MATATHVVTAQTLERRGSSVAAAVFAALMAILLPAIVLGLILPPSLALAIIFPSVLVLPFFWRSPIRGVYVLMGAALLIEIYPLGFPDSISDKIPIFLNLNNSTGLAGLSITPAELLMVAAIMIWLATGIAAGTLRWPSGRLTGPFLIYLLVLAGAELHGITAGGDFKISLWELRPQVYAFILFVLSSSLIKTRRDLKTVSILFMVAVGLRSVVAVFRYYVTLHGNVGHQEAVLAHEDSYFLALFLVGVVVALFWARSRRLQLGLLAFSPLVINALLANERRAGMFALEAGVAVVLLLVAWFDRQVRGRVVLAGVLLAVAVAGVTIVYWNRDYGIAAQIVRPVKSVLGQPSQRDYLSDIYRVAENANLKVSFQSSPIIGMGFGRPMLVVFPQADISQIYPFWNYIPHNTVLWVGMRMGIVGFIAFFALIGVAVLEGMNQVRTREDRFLRAVAAVAVAAIVAELAVGWADLQLENYRNMIFLGVVLGVINRLPQLPGHADA